LLLFRNAGLHGRDLNQDKLVKRQRLLLLNKSWNKPFDPIAQSTNCNKAKRKSLSKTEHG
jgi:hypothetical protein